MHITISGHNIEVGANLRDHVNTRISGLDRYQVKPVDGHVTFSKVGKGVDTIRAELTLSASGLVLNAHDDGTDAYAVFESAADKLENQLRRYKDRMKKHERRRTDMGSAFAPVEMAHHDLDEEDLENAPDDIFEEFMPKIVKKDTKVIQTLSVDEAVMQMDLLHAPFFVFTNAQTKTLNVVYRQGDGTIGWVAPGAA